MRGRAALAAAALLAACADASTGPRPSGAALASRSGKNTGTSSGPLEAGGTSGTSTNSTTVISTSGSTFSGGTSSGGTSSVVLTIGPTTTATFQIGAHRVQIVAGSICDPATSGYGPALWDAPCTPATSTVTVTATSSTGADGHPVVTFSPDLRFVPGRVNTIWLLDPAAAAAQAGVLAWCPTGSLTCVDEGTTDPSLVTQYTTEGYAYRRIKHFSGYTVVAE